MTGRECPGSWDGCGRSSAPNLPLAASTREGAAAHRRPRSAMDRSGPAARPDLWLAIRVATAGEGAAFRPLRLRPWRQPGRLPQRLHHARWTRPARLLIATPTAFIAINASTRRAAFAHFPTSPMRRSNFPAGSRFHLTGSHRNSIRAVASGEAQLAAIDAQSWWLALAHEPAADEVRMAGRSVDVPGLPLITATAFAKPTLPTSSPRWRQPLRSFRPIAEKPSAFAVVVEACERRRLRAPQAAAIRRRFTVIP